MSRAILDYLEHQLARRRRVHGALAECVFWHGVLSALRDGAHLRHAAGDTVLLDPTDTLATAIAELLTGNAREAAATLRLLADHLDSGGPVPGVRRALRSLAVVVW